MKCRKPEVPYYRQLVLPFRHDKIYYQLITIHQVEYLLANGRFQDFALSGSWSYAELRVYDSQGRLSGLLNGEVKEEISNSFYEGETIFILSPADSYRFEMFGTGTGLYHLALEYYRNGESLIFNAIRHTDNS